MTPKMLLDSTVGYPRDSLASFHGFRRYVFSTLRNEANVIIY